MPTPEALNWVRTRWIPALRSGGYAQGHALLRRSENLWGDPLEQHQFCCLGVACDLAVEDGILPAWVKNDWRNAVGRELNHQFLPSEMTFFLGMPATGISFDGYADLARANDKGVSFERIADALEAWCNEQEEEGFCGV